MKPLLFFALLLVPATYTNGQQATLKQVRQRTAPLPPQLDKLARWSEAATAQSAAPILDSTVLYAMTDLGGTFLATPLERMEYLNPGDDQQVIRESVHDGNHWTYIAQSTLTLDELGRVPLIVADRFDTESGLWQPDSRLWSYFHGTSATQLDSFSVEAWVQVTGTTGFWVSLMEQRNTFDAEDRLIKTETTIDGAGYQLRFRDLYFYDGSGNNVLIEQYYLDKEEEYHAGLWTMEYNGDLLVEEVFSIPDGYEGFLPDSRTTFAYTPFGQTMLVRNFTYDPYEEAWIMVNSTDYQYDSSDRLFTEVHSTYTGGMMDSRMRTTYQYFQETHLGFVNFETYDLDLGVYVLDVRLIYYYEPVSSLRPAPVSRSPLLFTPNPTTGTTRFVTDGDGYFALYELSGRQVSRDLVPSGARSNTVDLSTLPRGTYVGVVLVDGQPVKSGLIVRQ